MKKNFLLAAMAFSLTACVSNDDLTPVDNYGYVNLSVNNDPTVETRANVNIGTDNWQITYAETSGSGESGNITSASTKLPAGTYTFKAQNYASAEAALQANGKWGDAYYEGQHAGLVLTAGETKQVNIDCGKAKNARMKVEFNFGDLSDKFTNYSLVADPSDRNLTFDHTTADKHAYFAANATVAYTLTYTYNSSSSPKTVTGTIQMKSAATENVISIKANSNGTITISVTYDDQFDQGTNQDITIDAATGEQVKAAA